MYILAKGNPRNRIIEDFASVLFEPSYCEHRIKMIPSSLYSLSTIFNDTFAVESMFACHLIKSMRAHGHFSPLQYFIIFYMGLLLLHKKDALRRV